MESTAARMAAFTPIDAVLEAKTAKSNTCRPMMGRRSIPNVHEYRARLTGYVCRSGSPAAGENGDALSWLCVTCAQAPVDSEIGIGCLGPREGARSVSSVADSL